MKHRILCLILCSAFFCAMSASVSAQPQTRTASGRSGVQIKKEVPRGNIFVFHTNEFWLNLHHFLYVLGRAANKERDVARDAVAGAPSDQQQGLVKLSEADQKIWQETVAAYAMTWSKKDLVFDDPLPAITSALANAGEAKSITGLTIDPALVTILERAAPIYRKTWWPKHRDANRNWQRSIKALVDLHGAAVLAFITRAYQMEWPSSGFPVHVSGYANWAGAYSTKGDLLVLSSMASGNQATYGLESIFHEGMHQWDEKVDVILREQAGKLKKFFPRGLDHALIFFTAGEAVRHVFPEHVPYAEKYGVWQRGMSSMKVVLEEVWQPYLNGHGTRDEALADVIRRTAVEPPRK
jgi:hypothetical protein